MIFCCKFSIELLQPQKNKLINNVNKIKRKKLKRFCINLKGKAN